MKMLEGRAQGPQGPGSSDAERWEPGQLMDLLLGVWEKPRRKLCPMWGKGVEGQDRGREERREEQREGDRSRSRRNRDGQRQTHTEISRERGASKQREREGGGKGREREEGRRRGGGGRESTRKKNLGRSRKEKREGKVERMQGGEQKRRPEKEPEPEGEQLPGRGLAPSPGEEETCRRPARQLGESSSSQTTQEKVSTNRESTFLGTLVT